MISQELLDDIFAIRWPLPDLPEDDQISPHQRSAAVDDAWRPRIAFIQRLGATAAEHGPDHDALLAALEDLVAIKKAADVQIRLLLAYARVYVAPRPHTLETLGQAAGLTPSGVSRAFSAKEIHAVGGLIGRRPAAVEINDYRPDLFPSEDGRRWCTWGGSKNHPCTDKPMYAVTDKSGTNWACCESHLPDYLRSAPARHSA
jgi:hypothetical protein